MPTPTKKTLVILLILFLLGGVGVFVFSKHDAIVSLVFSPRSSTAQLGKSLQAPLKQETTSLFSETATTATAPAALVEPTVRLTGLAVPWEVAFLPDGTTLITERPGTLLHVTEQGTEKIPVSGVHHIGEGGLLGLALHPNYAENNWIYLYQTTETDAGVFNRVVRYTFSEENTALFEETVVIADIPGARNHDGGRIAFGPDGYLYVTTGDAGTADAAQDTSSLSGKILRVTDTGEAAPGNPFNNSVYSYGHRNPQGLAWDEQGRLWSSEHGPSGTQTGNDEINLIEAGGNYGWPKIKGQQTQEGMITPILESGSSDTWAPGDIAVSGSTILFTGLRGESLYSAQIVEDATGPTLKQLTAHYRRDFGRLRTVVLGPDKLLYLTTSNTDGRGTASESDDRVITLSPNVLTN